MKTRIWNLGRRDLLRGLGAGTIALLAPFSRELRARAQSAASPTRFVTLFQPNGIIEEHWLPSGSGTSFSMDGTVLEELAPFRDRLILLEGLDMGAAREDGNEGSKHQQGTGCLLTGAPLNPGPFDGCGGSCSGGWASGPSVDQAIAEHVGAETRFASLELGVQVEDSDNRSRIAYRGADSPLPPDDDPAHAFDRVFGEIAGMSEPDPRLDQLRVERRSVLDAVAADLADVRGRIGREHYERLDRHMEAIRDLERRVTELAPVDACTVPGSPSVGSYEAESRAQLDLIAAAFACDRTRVATLMWSRGGSERSFPWLGIRESWHSSIGHSTSDAAKEKMSTIHRWFTGEVAYFLGRLDELGLLDDTLVWWPNELNDGASHDIDDMKMVIAGSGGGFLRTGQSVHVGSRSHNCLLVTFLQAFGIARDSFGHPDHQSGALDEIHA